MAHDNVTIVADVDLGCVEVSITSNGETITFGADVDEKKWRKDTARKLMKAAKILLDFGKD
jgi:hypothetical protein